MKVEIKDIDYFEGNIIKVGGSLAFIMPSANVKFSGLAEGDKLKVYYKKVEPEREELKK